MDPVLARISDVERHLWILNRIDTHIDAPVCFAFLDKLFYALEHASHEDLSSLENLGSLLRRRQTLLGALKKHASESPDTMGMMTSGANEELVLNLLRYHLDDLSHHRFFNDLLWCAHHESPDELLELMEEFGRMIHRATDEELLDDYDLSQLMYEAGQVPMETLAAAIVDRVMPLPSERYLDLDVKKMIEGVTHLTMPQRPPHKLEHYSPRFSMRLYQAMDSLGPEAAFQHENFAQQCRTLVTHKARHSQSITHYTQQDIDTLLSSIQSYVDTLHAEQLEEYDPAHLKRDILRLALGRISQPNVPMVQGRAVQPDEMDDELFVMTMLEESRKTRPTMLCGTPEMRRLSRLGKYAEMEEIVKNYCESPDDAFVGFNPARYFSVLDGSDGLTTTRQALAWENMPPLVDPQVVEAFRDKLIRGFLAAPRLVDVTNAPQMIELIDKINPQVFIDDVMPRLYEEMIGEKYLSPALRKEQWLNQSVDRVIDRDLW